MSNPSPGLHCFSVFLSSHMPSPLAPLHGSVGRSGKCNCGWHGNLDAPPGSGGVCIASLTFFWVWGCRAGLGCIVPLKGHPPRSPKPSWAPEGCFCVVISVTCRGRGGGGALVSGAFWGLAPGLGLEPPDLGHQRVSRSWALRACVLAGGRAEQGSCVCAGSRWVAAVVCADQLSRTIRSP